VSLLQDTASLIDKKAWDEIESLWMARMESDPGDADDFLATAKALRKAEERSRADALLDLYADLLKERALWPQRLKVLKELARLSKRPQNLRPAIEEAVMHTWGESPSYEAVARAVGFTDADGNPADKAEKLENWLTFDVGQCFFMPGRGAGQVRELNPDLAVSRLDFIREKRVSIPLGAAQKFLTPLPEGHALRDRITDPEGFTRKALDQPAEMLGALLRSFGRPMNASEVKDTMIDVVPDNRWSSWWTAARKHPQIIATGSGAKAKYSWSSTAGAADDSVRSKFNKADLRGKLDLAKKHSSRSSELADYFASVLAAEAATMAHTEPALAWEVFATLDKLPGRYETSFDPKDILHSPLAARVTAAVSDRTLREQAVRTIRESNPEWPGVFAELFFLEEDPRVLTLIDGLLEEAGESAIRERLVDETQRYPRRRPRAFFWLAKKLNDSGEIPAKGANNFLQQLLDALVSDEFSSVKSRIKEFFDKGGLAVNIVSRGITEDQARKLVDTLERYGALEEYRREIVRGAALMKFPGLREAEVEPIFATGESLAAKREEFERLKTVEMPANLKAIQEAREMGDLRENFEYKAARQRQEYLTARVSELQSELVRVRVLDPEEVDTSEARVGTKLYLSNGDVHREVTILGPWESAPEQGVYSNQSDVARALLGRHEGEIVSFMGNDYRIDAIKRWNE
jgi:transcription elongation GreA/GreB family factor